MYLFILPLKNPVRALPTTHWGHEKAKSSIPNRTRTGGYWDSGHTRLTQSTRNKLIKTE